MGSAARRREGSRRGKSGTDCLGLQAVSVHPLRSAQFLPPLFPSAQAGPPLWFPASCLHLCKQELCSHSGRPESICLPGPALLGPPSFPPFPHHFLPGFLRRICCGQFLGGVYNACLGQKGRERRPQETCGETDQRKNRFLREVVTH